jgi:tetratricopeptide (TPR) repeat protein
MGRHLFGVLQRGYLALRYRSDTTGAVALVDSALAATPLDSLLRGDRRYDEVARFYLAAGRRDRVGALLLAAEENDSALHRPLIGERLWTRGLLARAEGRANEAIELLRQAAEKNYCTNCVFPDLGRAYEAAGRPQDAAEAYHRYITTPWLWRYEPDAVELGWTLKKLGELSAQLGNSARARTTYQKLLELWKEADPELLQALESVRGRLRELESGGR